MRIGTYELPERQVVLDENAAPADLLLVIGALADEVEWWQRQAAVYRDRAGPDPAFGVPGSGVPLVNIPPRFR